MSTLTKDEYLKASSALATGFGPTVDFTDPQIGSTVQSEDGIPTPASELPGQVFSVDQLPNPAVAVAYGLPPQTVPAHLILDDADDDVRHIQAKDPLDIMTGQLREHLGEPVLAFDNTVRSADDALGHFNASTGAGLGAGAEMEDGGEPFVDGIKGGDGESTTGDDIDAPIDPEGVQKGDGDKVSVSEQAGTQGQTTDQADAKGPDAADGAASAKTQDQLAEQAGGDADKPKGRRNS